MCRKDRETAESRARPRLVCSGIWGGIRNLDQDISAGGVFISLYSLSCDGGKGGDIYYFGVCRGDKVLRLAIADVVGHGQAVSDVLPDGGKQKQLSQGLLDQRDKVPPAMKEGRLFS